MPGEVEVVVGGRSNVKGKGKKIGGDERCVERWEEEL